MLRRNLLRSTAASATASVLAASLARPALSHDAAARALRVIPQANLTSLDPMWTTAVVTRNHGYLVYDTLASVDARGEPRPQMAEGWDVSADGLVWSFRLREGLRFHDGEPVRARDCVASVRRWARRDPFGQLMWASVDDLSATDDRSFRFRLRAPFPFLALSLGKSQSPAFIMPERLAVTDAFEQVRDATGSGPFRFAADEWNPGQRAVWRRFDAYAPRQEPVDGLAGGHVPRVERVEWTVISDPSTASSALSRGEQDYWEYPLHDLLPLLRRNRDVVVEQRLQEGTYAILRFNHLFPPFDDLAVRRAVAMAVDQGDYMRAVAGEDPAGWSACEAVLTCGTALSSDQGSDVLRVRSVERARAALAASGYRNQRVVLLAPSDYPQINAISLVTADLLRRIGINVELVATDWGTMVQRRASREPPERGGWNLIHTTASGTDLSLPATHLFLRANGPDAWFGWPADAEIERLRTAWLGAPDAGASKAIAAELNARAMAVLPYVPLGYYWQPSAWRRNLTGVFRSPVTAFWNIAKS